MDQLLNDFSPGLFFMQSFILLVLIVLMRKFAWKPILDSLQDREEDISNAIEAAKQAKEEMAKLTASNDNLLNEARAERDAMLKDAKKAGEDMVAEARATAISEGERMLEIARKAIETDKKAAMTDIKNEIAAVSLQVAEKLLRNELTVANTQRELVDKLISETNLN